MSPLRSLSDRVQDRVERDDHNPTGSESLYQKQNLENDLDKLFYTNKEILRQLNYGP